ncbi:DUF805 domain-containing protein [Lysobacter brunescens]|uniref:DUF805 domain-containing protein n=1 Tax=Lysobacter brunescens TaxID=262323 RepID=A0ABW2YFS8_9GAMM
MDWMLMPLKRYADFNGRSRRKEFWMFTLLNVIVTAVLYGLIIAGLDFETGQPGALSMVGGGLLLIYALAFLVPSIAVYVRRFHDQDKSGWLVLLMFVPAIGGLILLIFMCIEGTRGPNRFGEDPKAA